MFAIKFMLLELVFVLGWIASLGMATFTIEEESGVVMFVLQGWWATSSITAIVRVPND